MVAWFTVVVEANCTRQPVSFLFPHSGIRRRGGNNKETTSLVVLASDTNISMQPRQPLLVCTHPTAKTLLEFLSEMKLFATVCTAGSLT